MTASIPAGPVTTRLAPSPTGRMHAGNIYAALVAWILARRAGGRVLLRIDDLDASRCRQHYAEQCMRDFEMLGLSWDGPALYQSTRDEAYERAFEALAKSAHVYPCFCTRADLQAASAPHAGEHAVYAGTCRGLDELQVARKAASLAEQGRQPTLRLEVPAQCIAFSDLVHGEQCFDLARDCGDFVVRRGDGGFAYHLATVVDDDAQCVNLVVRGDDLLSSTPQQIHLQQLLGMESPAYAHIPLIVADDGRRLAKRNHDAGLDALLAQFKTPEGVLGHVAHVCGLVDSDEPRSAEILLDEADIDALKGGSSIAWA